MSWKTRYEFPTEENMIGEKFMLSTTSDKSRFAIDCYAELFGLVFECKDSDMAPRTSLMLVYDDKHWYGDYDFFKEHFIHIKD
jgi:hypothetical protein